MYDVALLDLDGVVYIGRAAISGVPKALTRARSAGMRLAFVTNNAARAPAVVAEHLNELGISAAPQEIITSAQAAAHYLADRLPSGSPVLVVGTTGLEEALRERGLVPVGDARGEVAAVVQGFSPDLDWHLLAEGAIAIKRGVPWVATNLDPTVPSPRGTLPGNGSLVAALRHATGVEPLVTGKPDPTMHRESVQRSRAQHPIVVGDRLDTDIEGANAAGCDSLLVLSGVTTARDLLAAAPSRRPTYLAADLAGLLAAHRPAEPVDGGAGCGAWRAVVEDHPARRLVLRRAGPAGESDEASEAGVQAGGPSEDQLDALRALCAAAWAADVGPDARVIPTGADADGRSAATAVIGVFGLG